MNCSLEFNLECSLPGGEDKGSSISFEGNNKDGCR